MKILCDDTITAAIGAFSLRRTWHILLGLVLVAIATPAFAAVLGNLKIQSRTGERLYAIMPVYEATLGPVVVEVIAGEDPALEGLTAGFMMTGQIATLVLSTQESMESDRLEARVRFVLPDGSTWVRGFDLPLRPRLVP